jgi:hypothetical protein
MDSNIAEPVKIKYYGLISMTRKAYLWATALAGLFALAFFVMGLAAGLLPPFAWSGNQIPKFANKPGFGAWFYEYFYWIIFILLLLEAIDIFLTLRKFAHKKAVLRARLSNLESKP